MVSGVVGMEALALCVVVSARVGGLCVWMGLPLLPGCVGVGRALVLNLLCSMCVCALAPDEGTREDDDDQGATLNGGGLSHISLCFCCFSWHGKAHSPSWGLSGEVAERV